MFEEREGQRRAVLWRVARNLKLQYKYLANWRVSALKLNINLLYTFYTYNLTLHTGLSRRGMQYLRRMGRNFEFCANYQVDFAEFRVQIEDIIIVYL
jgi:hypothetical protein